MTLFNPFANSVADPRTARRAWMRSTRALTAAEEALVQAAYAVFCLNAQTAVARYLTHERTLADGTHVRFESNDGLDRVFVTPPGGGSSERAESGGFVIRPTDLADTRVWNPVFMRTVEYAPSTLGQKYKLPKDDQPAPKFLVNSTQQTGPVSWRGTYTPDGGDVRECVLSYDHGLLTRYRLYPEQDCSGRYKGSGQFANAGADGVYMWGSKIPTTYADQVVKVVGAGMFGEHLCIITHADFDWVYDAGDPTDIDIQRANVWSKTATLMFLGPRGWEVVAKFIKSAAIKAPWFFKPDGSEACSLYETTFATQKKLTFSLVHATRTVDGNEESYVTATTATSDLDAVAIVVDTDSDPEVTETAGDLGWEDVGHLNPEMGFWGNTETREYDPDGPITGIILNFFDTGQYLPWVPFDWNNFGAFNSSAVGIGSSLLRDAALQDISALAVADADFSIGIATATGCIYPFSNGGAGVIRAFRNTRNVSTDDLWEGEYPRDAAGKHYMALDYRFDGTPTYLVSELIDEGSRYYFSHHEKVYESHEYQGDARVRPIQVGWDGPGQLGTVNVYDISENTYTWVSAGQTKWKLSTANTDGMVQFVGGVEDGASNESTLTMRTKTLRGGGTPVDSIDYIEPDNNLVTERGWILDADLRTNSVVYSKTKLTYNVAGIDTSDPASVLNTFIIKIEGSCQQQSSLHIVRNGEQVFERIWSVDAPSKYFRPYGVMLETIPRLHDYVDQLEETSFLQDLTWNDGEPRSTSRHWKLADNFMPRKFAPGTLQVRSDKQQVVSASNKTTAYTESGNVTVTYHATEFATKAWVGDTAYALIDNLSPVLTDLIVHGDPALGGDLHIDPVKAV